MLFGLRGIVYIVRIRVLLRFIKKSKFTKMSEFDRKIITDAITRMLARREIITLVTPNVL